MSIFSRRKRTRRLVSLAISAVATSLCSSQVALCLPLVINGEEFVFDGNDVYILGYNANNREQKFEMEIKVGKYKVYLTSERAKFLQKVGKRCCESGYMTIDFSEYQRAEYELDLLKQRFERQQEKGQVGLNNIEQVEELNIEQVIKQNMKQVEKLNIGQVTKQKVDQEMEQKWEYNANINELYDLLKEFEFEYHVDYSKYDYTLKIPKSKPLRTTENSLREIVLRDQTIQLALKFPKFYETSQMVNVSDRFEFKKVHITEDDEKFIIKVTL